MQEIACMPNWKIGEFAENRKSSSLVKTFCGGVERVDPRGMAPSAYGCLVCLGHCGGGMLLTTSAVNYPKPLNEQPAQCGIADQAARHRYLLSARHLYEGLIFDTSRCNRSVLKRPELYNRSLLPTCLPSNRFSFNLNLIHLI